jgi:hypothetical protein
MPTLIIQLPGLPPVEHVLHEEAITIGRMQGNTIALDDESVSMSHARIIRLGYHYFLKDLSSTNGTMLNGQSIREVKLTDGDQLKFGEVRAEFRLAPSANSEPATAGTVSRRAASTPDDRPVPLFARSGETAHLRRVTAARRPSVPVTFGLLVAIAAVGLGIAWLPKYFSKPAPGSVATPPPAANPRPGADAAPATAPAAPPPHHQSGSNSILALQTALQSPVLPERQEAVQVIYARPDIEPELLPVLKTALKDTDSEVRIWAALALVKSRAYDPAATPVLVEVLRHENPALRQMACISLALFSYTPEQRAIVVSALTNVAARDVSQDVRQDAQRALNFLTVEQR